MCIYGMRFKKYLIKEGFEVFGFEYQKNAPADFINRSPNAPMRDKDFPMPIRRFNIERLNEALLRHNIGIKPAISRQFDVIEWGDSIGSLRVRYSTKFDVIIEKSMSDLQGDKIWVAKKFLNINTKYFSGQEELIANEILDQVERFDYVEIYSPSPKMNDLNKLSKSIAIRSSAVVNDPLFYEDTRKYNDNYYSITFGIRGQGVQARGQSRVEQVVINLSFNEEKGIVNASQQMIKSDLSQHTWEVAPQEQHFRFSPNQNENEIISVLTTAMKYF
mgnify:FL=1